MVNARAVLRKSGRVAVGLFVMLTSCVSAGHASTAPSSPASVSPSPVFSGSVNALTQEQKNWMRNTTWHKGCPIPMGHLRLLNVSYYNFDGEVESGRIVVNQKVAANVVSVFQMLFEHEFPIEHVDTVELYPKLQRPGKLRNVTVGFNCRDISGTTTWSQHAYGLAIDINPVQNPEIKDGKVIPKAGKAYVDRSKNLQGMIHRGDAVVHAFTSIGWGWGGKWHSLKDYMHFSLSGG